MSAEPESFELEGPTPHRREVRAWSDAPLPFDNLSPSQRALRTCLPERLAQLTAEGGEILHATYSGPKDPRADIENTLLYNVDQGGRSLRAAAGHGVRFELDEGAVLEAPSGRPWRCSYRYRVAPREAGFSAWRPTRELAAFEAVDLGRFPSEHRLAQVWLALRRASGRVASEPIRPETRFGVRLRLQTAASQSAAPELVKSLVDGALAALQAHADRGTVEDVSARLATQLGASPEELARELLDDRGAVLGVARRLLYPTGDRRAMGFRRPPVPRGRGAGRAGGRRWLDHQRRRRGAAASEEGRAVGEWAGIGQQSHAEARRSV